jgi:glycosyltransferase involved in cell wall biosynthesis
MHDKKKLLFLIPNLGKGGAERILAHLLNHLNREFFSIGCIFYDDRHAHPIPPDVMVFNINLPGTRNIAKKLSRYVLRIIKIRAIIATYKPDCFMSFMMNIPAIISIRLSSIKPRCIISVHNFKNIEENGIKGQLAKLFYPYADRIIAVSQELKTWLEAQFKIDPDKISVIYNPIDINEINKLRQEPTRELSWFIEDIPVIITAGRLTYQKGQKYLLNAFAFCNGKTRLRLVILGEGPEESRLKRLAHALRIEQCVSFLGFQTNPFKFFARSTIFVLSSVFEGFGNVIVEAMACGVPVISTDCPVGPREIIKNGHNGILVPPKNADLLAEAMCRLLSSKDERERLSQNALENLRQYDVSTIVSRYETVFSSHK